MKPFLNEPFELGNGYATYTFYMSKDDNNIDIIKCPKINMPEDLNKDSFIDFLWKEIQNSDDFKNFSTFIVFRFSKEQYNKDVVANLLYHSFYPGLKKEEISITRYQYSNGWECIRFFDNDICILNKEETDNYTKVFIALPGELSDKKSISQECIWNDIVSGENFFKVIKSKIVEELINAEIYG